MMPCESRNPDELLDELKTVLKESGTASHLPDDVLLRVLTARQFNVEKARILAARYVNAKKNHPELFPATTNHNEDILRRAGTILPQEVRTVDGHRCAFTLGVNWDPDCYKLEPMVQALIYVLEAQDLDKELHKNGYVHFVDAANLGWKHVKTIRPHIVIASSSLIAHELPVHLKQIVVYNANWMVDVIWKICKPLLPSELVKLITIIDEKHKDKLYKFLSQEAVEKNLFVPSPESIDDHVRYLMENRDNISKLWSVVFNEEVM